MERYNRCWFHRVIVQTTIRYDEIGESAGKVRERSVDGLNLLTHYQIGKIF